MHDACECEADSEADYASGQARDLMDAAAAQRDRRYVDYDGVFRPMPTVDRTKMKVITDMVSQWPRICVCDDRVIHASTALPPCTGPVPRMHFFLRGVCV